MRRRAASVEATRTRILDAARELWRERLDPERITVEETASRAGVSGMTVARHFRSKADLIAALETRERNRVRAIGTAVVGDIRAVVGGLYEHYDEAGDFFLQTQAIERIRPGMHELLNRARKYHRGWVASAFAPQLERIAPSEREEVITALVVACDVLTWKQLRRDLKLSRRKAESIVRRMVSALTKEE